MSNRHGIRARWAFAVAALLLVAGFASGWYVAAQRTAERDQALAVTLPLADQLMALCEAGDAQADRLVDAGVCSRARAVQDNPDTPVAPTPVPGPQGPRGFTGLTGLTGDTGATGRPGDDGRRGSVGRDGIGVTGETGAAGLVGPQGEVGPEGPQGQPGADGKDGQSAFPFVFEFTVETNPAQSTTYTVSCDQGGCTVTAVTTP